MCGNMLVQNVLFFCSFITLSQVNSGRDIRFCSKCGISVGDTFSRDILVLLVCAVGKSCNASLFCVGFLTFGVMKLH